LTIGVEYLAGERTGRGTGFAACVTMVIGGKLCLDGIEQGLVDNRFMLADMRLSAMDDLAEIKSGSSNIWDRPEQLNGMLPCGKPRARDPTLGKRIPAAVSSLASAGSDFNSR